MNLIQDNLNSVMAQTTRQRFKSLLEYREAHGLSQRAAAKQFGISQGCWSRVERGIDRPGKSVMKRMIQRTGVPIEVLVGLA